MKAALGLIFRTLLVFALVEGVCSLLLLALVVPLQVRPPLAERQHTRYDAELGWVNLSGLQIEDMYGPGVSLTINSEGFRSRHEFPRQVADGAVRVICLGDSFTLGYGVADDETWCAQLGQLDRRFETVNMGQGGYGIDQAYLWYARDASSMDHQVTVFAFIAEDFRRMQDDQFSGYGKPVLSVEDGHLVTGNVPVPRRGYLAPWITQNLDLLTQLRSLELLRSVMRSGPEAEDGIDEVRMASLTNAIFGELSRLNRERGSRLVLVYLPMRIEYDSSYLDGWVEFVGREAAAQNLPFIDLRSPMRKLPPRQVEKLYIPEGFLTYPNAAGHFTAEGNAWVAEQIYARWQQSGGAVPRASGARRKTPSPGS